MLKNIFIEMKRKHINGMQLSKELGISRKTLSNWISGRTEIKGSALVQMAEIFHCSTDYLLGLSPFPITQEGDEDDEGK